MTYALSPPSSARRSGLLVVVIALHAALLLTLVVVRNLVPQLIESPLLVDLIEPAQMQEQPRPKPQPVVKPAPLKTVQAALPKAALPAPSIEPSRNELASPAPLGATETKPAVPAVAAAPVSPARFDVDYLKNPAPAYPPLSRRMGEEGRVMLRVLVTPEGVADDVEVRTSSGSTRLDDAAARTVKNWKFIPAKRGDAAVQSWVLVPIIFKLEH